MTLPRTSSSTLLATRSPPIRNNTMCLRVCFLILAFLLTPNSGAQTAPDIHLPLEAKSVRFAVIGDSGTGEHAQYEVAQRMELYRETVNFDFVIMLGDNIYGGHRPQDFRKKFEMPYHTLLDAGVKFYASLGNHDDPDERLYKPFNMGGQRYYTFN